LKPAVRGVTLPKTGNYFSHHEDVALTHVLLENKVSDKAQNQAPLTAA